MESHLPDRAAGSTAAPQAPAASNAIPLSDRVRSLRLPDRLDSPRPGSRPWPWWLAGVLGVACLALLANTVLQTYRSDGTPARPATPNRSPSTAKLTPPPAATDVVLETKGYIIPGHLIKVSPKVSGLIVKLYIEKEGQVFRKGDLLAEIESDVYQAEYDRAVAQLGESKHLLEEMTEHRAKEVEQARARLEETEAQRKQLDMDRRRTLRLKGDNAMAQREFELAESAYLAMVGRERVLRLEYELTIRGPRDNRIAAARERIRQSEAGVARARWELDNCKVRAPVSGTILSKKAEEGNLVNPFAFNVASFICEMADLSDLEVDLNVQEREVRKVFEGQRCTIRTEAYPNQVHDGVVSRVMPMADRGKGAVPVRVKIRVPREDEGLRLKPEMGAVVTFYKE